MAFKTIIDSNLLAPVQRNLFTGEPDDAVLHVCTWLVLACMSVSMRALATC